MKAIEKVEKIENCYSVGYLHAPDGAFNGHPRDVRPRDVRTASNQN
jgi:hypothetical protein